jgi:lysophospholipase L1-like esterase
MSNRVGRPVFALAVALLVSGPPLAAAQAADPDPGRFAAEIGAFEEMDRKNTPPSGAVLFVGSSSIRLWPTAERFPALTVINRGFGGSHISDVIHYIDRTVLKYRPDVVVFYAGDNDLASGKTPERVLADYQTFVGRVLASRPGARILYIAVKPSLARWALWPTIQKANDLIRAFSASRTNLGFADVVPPMLTPGGTPRPELLVEDGLHMTPAGYDIWTEVVARSLEAVP